MDSSIEFSRMFLSSSTWFQTPRSKSTNAAVAAAAMPTAPTIFSVPDLLPISCPPPIISGDKGVLTSKTRAPVPFGPPNL